MNIAVIIGIILLVVVIFILITSLLRWLWNITIPEVLGLKEITFWQAFRILIIASILFKDAPNDEFRKIRTGVDNINKKLEMIINAETYTN